MTSAARTSHSDSDLAVQERYSAAAGAPEVAQRIGYDVVRFRRGRIQDLALDLNQLETWLREHRDTRAKPRASSFAKHV